MPEEGRLPHLTASILSKQSWQLTATPSLLPNLKTHLPCYIMVFAIQLYKAYYLVGSLYYNYYFSYLPISYI
jgi:hypothetical protein